MFALKFALNIHWSLLMNCTTTISFHFSRIFRWKRFIIFKRKKMPNENILQSLIFIFAMRDMAAMKLWFDFYFLFIISQFILTFQNPFEKETVLMLRMINHTKWKSSFSSIINFMRESNLFTTIYLKFKVGCESHNGRKLKTKIIIMQSTDVWSSLQNIFQVFAWNEHTFHIELYSQVFNWLNYEGEM